MKKAFLLIFGGLSLVILGMVIRPLCGKVAHRIQDYFSPTTVIREPVDPIYPVISVEEQLAIDNAVRISFTGDLILLRDMVERAYNKKNDTFKFDGMFEHVKEYWEDDENLYEFSDFDAWAELKEVEDDYLEKYGG